MDGSIDGEVDRQIDRSIDRQTDRETDRQTYIQTDRHTGRHRSTLPFAYHLHCLDQGIRLLDHYSLYNAFVMSESDSDSVATTVVARSIATTVRQGNCTPTLSDGTVTPTIADDTDVTNRADLDDFCNGNCMVDDVSPERPARSRSPVAKYLLPPAGWEPYPAAGPSKARLERLTREGIHVVTRKPYDVIEAVAARYPALQFKCGICADPVIRLRRYQPEWYRTMWIILEAPGSNESGNFEIDTIAYFRRSALRTRLTNVLPGGEGGGLNDHTTPTSCGGVLR